MKTTSITTQRQEAATDESEYETLALSIDSSGVEHLMGTLTNLYSNPLESVFREYVSNALDSHIKSKNKAPIRVDLIQESHYSNQLRVQDFGTGMSKDDVVNVYSKYASSTKRDSNEQIGAFGLGAKSALAIADRFDVVSIKDGIELVFFIKKNTRGVGVVHFVSESPSTEANGVTVTIPLSKDHLTALQNLTANGGFFSTWNPSLVLFNGKSIMSPYNVYNEDKFVTLYSGESILGWVTVSDLTSKEHRNYTEKISLTISGIRYNLDASSSSNMRTNRFSSLMNEKVSSFFDGLKAWGFGLTLNLPIGSVDLTPSREEVMVTEKTMRTLRVAFEQAAEEIPRAFFSRLNKTKLKDAFSFYSDHLPVFGIPNGSTGSYEYWPDFSSLRAPVIKHKGVTMATSVELPQVFLLEAKNASAWEEKWRTISEINYFSVKHGHTTSKSYGHGKNSQSFYMGISYRNYYNAIVVYGEDTEENRKTIKRNARSYCQAEHDSAYPIVYFVPTVTAPTDKWLAQVTTPVSIETLETVGKAYRSAKSKEAALNRDKTVKRPVSIHYGATYDRATKEYSIRKFSADEIKGYKQVIVVNADEMPLNSYELYHNPARGMYQNFWANLQDMYDSDATGYESDYNILKRLARTFEGNLVIALPRSRAIGPIEKANSNTVLIHKAIENRIEEISKDKAKLEILQAIADVITEKNNNHGPRRVIDTIVEAGLSDEITNPLTRKVFEQIGNSGQLADLILLGRCFVSLTPKSIKANPEKYNTLIPFLKVNGVSSTSGWGQGYKYINAEVSEENETHKANIFIKLVNALDSMTL
jgi:hypothetical protein